MLQNFSDTQYVKFEEGIYLKRLTQYLSLAFVKRYRKVYSVQTRLIESKYFLFF